MIYRTTDREVEETDGRLEFRVDGKVVFRMIDEHDSKGGGSYAYRPDELVVDDQWAGVEANADLIKKYVNLDDPKERFKGGAVYRVRRTKVLKTMDVPEILEEILNNAHLQPTDSDHSGEQVAPLPVGPHLVFFAQYHGPPFGPGRPPRKLGRPLADLPDPQERQPGYQVKIGVIDTGVFRKHPWWDGKGRVVATAGDEEPNPDFDSGTGERSVTSGHGTFIDGVILRCAPGATIVSRRVVGGAFGEFDESRLVTVLNELADMEEPVDLVNVSFGAYAPKDRVPLLLNAFLKDRKDGKPVVVACACNHSTNEPLYPAAHPDVVGVGAVEDTGDRAGFSNYGRWVDTYARGVNLQSTFIRWRKADGSPDGPDGSPEGAEQGPWATWSGTSFAAPRVCGMIAAAMRPNGHADPGIDVVTATNQVLQRRRRPQDLGPLVEAAFVVPDPD